MSIYQNELKSINTPEKAYLLGFLYGDGCITKYLDGKRVRYQTKISIHAKDKDLITNLHKLFRFFNVNNFDYSKYNKNFGKQISITSTSKKLFDDLSSNGLFIRKSYENKENLRLPKISHQLLSHFIRGFFDSDGSVYKLKARKNLLHISISSNSNNFIHEVDNYLKNKNINSWKVVEKKLGSKGKQICFELAIHKTEDVLKFKEYIYKDSTIHLERKKKLFDEHKIVNKVKDRKINCPNCNSLNTLKNGIRDNKIRMKCGDCKKGFTLK